MAVRLTENQVHKATAGERRREIADAVAPGLYLVVQPSGARAFAFRYRWQGKSRKLTLGACPPLTLADARDMARDAAVALGKGNDPAEARKAARTAPVVPERDRFEVVAEEFLSRHVRRNLKASTARDYENTLAKHVTPHWEGRDIKTIGRRDVVEVLDRMADAGIGVKRNRTKAVLSKLFNWCLSRGIVDASPVVGIERPTAETARERVLTDREIAAVWRASGRIGHPWDALVRLLILTGQRRGEVAEMRWQEIDRDAATWTIPAGRTKNGREHIVPLAAPALEILEAVPRVRGSDFVFTTNGVAAVSGFSVAKRRLDALAAHEMADEGGEPRPLAPWVFHDLRRSYASGCARIGVPVHVVERALNHISGSFAGVVGVYQRETFATEVRAAMDRWASHVVALGEGAPKAAA